MSQLIDVDKLLNDFVDKDGSDCHMLVGEPPTFRIHGRIIRQHDYGVLTPERTEAFVKEIEMCIRDSDRCEATSFPPSLR